MEENHRVNKNDISTLRLPTYYNEWVLKVGRSKSKDRNKSLKAKKKRKWNASKNKNSKSNKGCVSKNTFIYRRKFSLNYPDKMRRKS